MIDNRYKHILEHGAFWLGYYLLLVYVLGKDDGLFGRVFIGEAIQLPAKIAATYFLFWFIERYSTYERYLLLIAAVIAVVVIAAFINRSLMYYWIRPTWFQDYYMFFWNEYRITVDVTDVGIPVTGAIMLRLLRARLLSREQEESLRREKTEAELQLLRSQVNPHFLFNTLNSLYALARTGSAQTADATLRLSNILRFALYEGSKSLVSISKEIALIHDYIALEKLRYEEGRLHVNFSESVQSPDSSIAPMLLLPLVENAFKHGASKLRTASVIDISIELNQQVLTMNVANSFDADAPNLALTSEAKNSGMGLRNVRRQLELLYPGRSSLSVQSEKDIFRVSLCVCLQDVRHES